MPQLPKAQKSFPSPKGSRESHKVSQSLGVNGMYHLHWGHDGFANGDSPLSDEMYEWLRELSKRKDWWILGGRRKQVTQSHHNTFSSSFLFHPPPTPHGGAGMEEGLIQLKGLAAPSSTQLSKDAKFQATHILQWWETRRAEREGRWKKDNDSHGVGRKVGKV